MNRNSVQVLGLAACSLVAGCAGNGRLSADEIVSRNAAARGGLEAWRKVETMVWNGHVESAHSPIPSMPFELDQKRPNKTRFQVYALGDRSLRIFDGERGWKVRSTRGRPSVEPYAPQELRAAATGHGLDGPLVGYAASRSTVTLNGVDRVGDRKAYHLSVLAKEGTEDVWVDTETYLELRSDRTVEGPNGEQRRVSTTYGDWRTVDGLKVPFLVSTGEGPGVTPDRMRIGNVVLNAPLEDALFAGPTGAAPRDRPRSLSGRAAPVSTTLPWTTPDGARAERGSARR